jgi:MFS family permease
LGNVSYRIDYLHPASLDNWITQLGLECASKYQIGMIGSMSFAGMVLGCLSVPPLGDKYGRKYPTIGFLLLAAISVSVLLASNSLFWTFFGTFLMGIVKGARSTLGFCYMVEFLPKRNQALITTLWNLVEASILIIVTIYFMWISHVWTYFGYFILGLIAFAIVSILIFIPESPVYLCAN